MNKKLQIFYIYADDCHTCEKILGWIDEITSSHKISLQLLKFKYNDTIALNIAIKNNIEDLPGIVIGLGDAVFQGKSILKEDLESAMLNSWKQK